MKPTLPELTAKENMLGRIASAMIGRYKIVYLIIMTLLITGFMAYRDLPKEIVPDVSLNTLYVYAMYPGASPETIEELLAEPVEGKLEGLGDTTSLETSINAGYFQTIVGFEEGTDMDGAEQRVRNAVEEVEWPEGAFDPVFGIIETGEIPLMTLTMTGDYDLADLKRYAERLEAEIDAVPGVREVDLSGGREREIQLIADERAMTALGVTPALIENALRSADITLPAGDVVIDGEAVTVRVDERFDRLDKLENLVVMTAPGRTVYLRDVAEVRDGYEEERDRSRVFIRSESTESTPAVYMTILRESGYDVLEPSTAVHGIIDEAPGNLIPEGVSLVVTMDQAEDVERDLSTVISNALGGLLTVIIVLYIFIGLNESLIVSMVIPLSLFISFLLMQATGISFNTISLTGFIIALGLLVDNAIVVMENIDRLRDEGVVRHEAARAGTNQVAPAILAATLTTVGAFLPVALTGGTLGKFLSVMPRTVIYILSASFVVSIAITPALCARFLTPVKKKGSSRLKPRHRHLLSGIAIFGLSMLAFTDEWQITLYTVIAALFFTAVYAIKVYTKERSGEGDSLITRYGHWLGGLLVDRGKKAIALVLVLATFGAAVSTVITGFLPLELFPYTEPASIVIDLETPVGTPLADTDARVRQVEEILYDMDVFDSFTSTAGGNRSHLGTVTAELIDADDREETGTEIKEALRIELERIPGISFTLTEQSAMGQVAGGAAFSVGLRGDDLETLSEAAAMYLSVLEQFEGVIDPRTSEDGGAGEINIRVDPNRAAHYGLAVNQIAGTIRQRVSGSTVGTFDDGEEVAITLYIGDERIDSLRDFDRIRWTNARGETVHFADVAVIERSVGSSRIQREDGDRVLFVEADLAEGVNGQALMAEFQEEVATLNLPRGVVPVVGGEVAELNTQIQTMLRNFVIALLLVYIVLAVQFNSLLQPVVILVSVPFAFIGVVVGLLITNSSLGFYAMFGIVALVGIAVNDAIVLIDYANYLRSTGEQLLGAVVRAVKTRFIPVIATSLTTIGGVLPLALYNDTFRQLGVALIFGLLAATVLTLFIIPMIYYSLEKRFIPKGGEEHA